MPACSKKSPQPQPGKAAPRRTSARAVSSTLSYALAAAGPRSVPPAVKHNQTSAADDLNQLMSIISIIDTNELVILAKEFRAAASPTEKLICLIEHASLVGAIENNKF
ncbi:hypothetical protein EVAR_50369_1 [Eumeta japonica]|uniref:Uncharacterized protein n=1 Tax=Eumeta variegata TaxID=151549 RepID=A0A4C1XZT4_EUMVA|nr:hypothetical protein EVAR_50369_1 [Eumeta japonica]